VARETITLSITDGPLTIGLSAFMASEDSHRAERRSLDSSINIIIFRGGRGLIRKAVTGCSAKASIDLLILPAAGLRIEDSIGNSDTGDKEDCRLKSSTGTLTFSAGFGFVIS
jgi:hypothetical protein